MSRRYLPLAALAALPLLVPAGLAWRAGFDGLYGQDAYAYFDYAVGPLTAALRAGQPPPPFFWPPGYPLLVALLTMTTGPLPQAAQLISLLAGIAVVMATVWLAAELWPWPRTRTPGMALAGLLAAGVGQLWQSSVVVMADTTGLAAATVGMAALLRYGRPEEGPLRARWLSLAAVCLAFAVLTRWAYALVALVAVGFTLGVWRRQPRRVVWRHAVAAAFPALVVLAPLVWSFLTGAVDPVSGRAAFAGNLQVYTWSPLHALRREFLTPDGLLRHRWPNGLWYALAPAHPYFFTPALAPFLAVGVVAALHRCRRGETRRWLPVLAWAAVIPLFHAGAAWQNFRFNLAHLPALALLAALGVITVAMGCRRLPLPRLRRPALAFLSMWVFGGWLLMARGGLELTSAFIARKQADLAIVRRVEALLPADARLLTFQLTPTFRHYGRSESHDLFYLAPAQLDVWIADGRPLYLLLDRTNVLSQWEGKPPAMHYHRLAKEPGLVEMARFGAYTLWCVGGAERCGSP